MHLQSITRHNQGELIHNFKFNLFGSEFFIDCNTYIKLYLCYYIKAYYASYIAKPNDSNWIFNQRNEVTQYCLVALIRL